MSLEHKENIMSSSGSGGARLRALPDAKSKQQKAELSARLLGSTHE
jgi:hypothetical protein